MLLSVCMSVRSSAWMHSCLHPSLSTTCLLKKRQDKPSEFEFSVFKSEPFHRVTGTLLLSYKENDIKLMDEFTFYVVFNIGIIHDFLCINICLVPREVLKPEAERVPLAFVAGSWQDHWWGFISRNYVIWPSSFLWMFSLLFKEII